MRKLLFLACVAALNPMSPAIASETENESLQKLVDQLKTVTEKSRQQRAADRWLQSALEDLVARYEWPWRQQILSEDFSDGNYSENPSWQVTSGQFWVDGRLGLRSRTQAPQQQESAAREEQPDLGKALLGALIKEAFRENGRQEQPQRMEKDEPAGIHLASSIPNVFAARFEFSAHNRPGENGQLSFALSQDDPATSGYEMILYTGERPTLELISRRSGRTAIIGSAALEGIDDGQSHSIDWRRDPKGDILVLVDDNKLIETRDHSFRYPFKYLGITNTQGDFAVASISIHGGD
jgi:hypothetical protein